MYIYIYIERERYIHACMHTYIHTYIHTCIAVVVIIIKINAAIIMIAAIIIIVILIVTNAMTMELRAPQAVGTSLGRYINDLLREPGALGGGGVLTL